MRKGYIKKLAVILTTILVVSSLTACGSNKQADDKTLVVGMDYFSGKFSTFFGKTSYDNDVADMTTVYLLTKDRGGAVVMHGIAGEMVAYNGTDYTYHGMGDCVVT